MNIIWNILIFTHYSINVYGENTMICFMLAGGFAKRMWPLTKDYPKCLLPLNGKPILLDLLKDVAMYNTYISTNQSFSRRIQDAVGKYGVNVIVEPTTSNEEKLGSVGAILRFLEENAIDDDLLVIATDNYIEGLSDFIESFDGNPLIGVYDVQDVALAKNYGVVVEKNSLVVDFKEKPKAPKSTIIGIGAYILPKEVLSSLKEMPPEKRDHLGYIVEHLLQSMKVGAYMFNGFWADIGSTGQYIQAHETLSKKATYIEKAHICNASIKNSMILGSSYIDGCDVEDAILFDAKIIGKDVKKKLIVCDEEVDITY